MWNVVEDNHVRRHGVVMHGVLEFSFDTSCTMSPHHTLHDMHETSVTSQKCRNTIDEAYIWANLP